MAQDDFITFATFVFPIFMFIFLLFGINEVRATGIVWNIYTISFFVTLPFAALAAIIYTNDVFVPAFSNFTVFAFGILLLITFALLVFNSLETYYGTVKNAVTFLVSCVIVVVGLAIIFSILTYAFSSATVALWLKVLFYIPALISDFVRDVATQSKYAPRPIVILLVVELCAIAFAILLPALISQNPPMYSSLQRNGVELLQTGPLVLTNQKEVVLANSHQLSVINDSTASDNPYKKQFTLSMWVYMNPAEAALITQQETTLLYFGTKEMDENGDWYIAYPKPHVTYLYDPTMKRDMYNIYLNESTPRKPTYRLTIPNQKWNHLVFIYQEDRVDLFVNGHLEKSLPISSGITQTYVPSDTITIGDINSSLYGAVANIIYYDYPMTKNQVVDAWNKQKYWVDGTLYIPYSRAHS